MTVTSTTTDLLRASPVLVVGIKGAGVVLPRYDEEAERVLDLDALRLVLTLAGPGLDPQDRSGVDEELLAALHDRALVVETTEPPSRADLGSGSSGSEGEAAPLDRAAPLVLPTPLLLGCGPAGFEFRDHAGQLRAALGAAELLSAAELRVPLTLAEADEAQRRVLGDDALGEAEFAALVERLVAAGLVVHFDPDDEVHARKTRQTEAVHDGMRRQGAVHTEFDRLEAEHDARGGDAGRVPVVGVHTSWSGLPASLGMLLAAAKAHADGSLEDHYDFRPRLLWDQARLQAAAGGRPGIYLFSNYIWSTPQNLGLSALVKAAGKHNVTIHGGPDTPKYPEDAARFFADNPHVDIAVHGEGEATFADLLEALAGHVGDGPADLERLRDVPGLTFRTPDGIHQTDKRDRIADLDSIPSPILTGLFDGFAPAGASGAVVLETNRGCPYGCTFCDWGSATLSRIRKFDLDRVFAELEWCGRHHIQTVGIADANFGIMERDVAIAEKIAELKAEHGYPRFVGNNYAKNTTKHLAKIIDVFTDAGIVAEGKLSMQTFDQGTLTTIRRKNIKVEKYHDLSVEFRRNELPLSVDIMMGLPGSTPEAFRRDLQSCIDRDLRAVIHSTLLLPNSPMNDPEYRAENGIVARAGEEVRQTSSFTLAEWEQMYRLMMSFYLFENFGILRHLAPYVHAETGMREVDFYQRLVEDAHERPAEWPRVATTLRVLPDLMVPPVSWRSFVDEIHGYLVDEIGIRDDEALDTVLTVQHALLPARDRTFPLELELPHDYVQWRRQIFRLREDGAVADWHEAATPLREQAAGRFTIRDPYEVCSLAIGGSLRSLSVENSWDLESPVSRPRQRLAA